LSLFRSTTTRPNAIRIKVPDVPVFLRKPLSPLLANIVLDPLDKTLVARGHMFARYADDFIVMVKSARAAQRVMKSLTAPLRHCALFRFLRPGLVAMLRNWASSWAATARSSGPAKPRSDSKYGYVRSRPAAGDVTCAASSTNCDAMSPGGSTTLVSATPISPFWRWINGSDEG